MIIEFKDIMLGKDGESSIAPVIEKCGMLTTRAYFDLSSLPKDIPQDVNPRKTHVDSDVTKAIETSLSQFNPLFHEMNRGLVIICEDVKIDREKNTLTIRICNDPYEGIADGGHTYRCIMNYINKLPKGVMYVPIEFDWGDEDARRKYALLISIARNTARSVSAEAIAEHRGEYEMLKEVWEGQPYAFRVIYEGNAEAELSIAKILKMLNTFDMSKFKNKDGEFQSKGINTKKSRVDHYTALYKKYGKTIENPYYAMRNIILDIFDCYELYEKNMPIYAAQAHIEWGSLLRGSGKKPQRFDAINPGETLFNSEKKISYSPRTMIFTLLVTLRPLVEIGEDGFYRWKRDPREFIEEYGVEFVDIVFRKYYINNNNHIPAQTADNISLWEDLYEASSLLLEMSNGNND